MSENGKMRNRIMGLIVAVLIVTSFIAGFVVGKAEERKSYEIDPETSTYKVEINTTKTDEDGFNTYISTNIKYLENDKNCGGMHIKGEAAPLDKEKK